MAEKEIGRGKKVCPKCGHVMGVRCHACEKCGHKFTFKTAATAATAPASMVDLASNITSTLALVDDVRKLAVDLNGHLSAGNVLDRIEALAEKCGGIQGLKGVINSVVGAPPVVAVVPVVTPVIAEEAAPAPRARKKGSKATEEKPAEVPVEAPAPAPTPEAEVKVA